jgi:putative copper resistance protein D
MTRLYDWLLFLHIVAAMVWVGGTVLLSALAARTVRSRDADAVARFVGSLRVIGPLVLAPAPAVLLGVGIWMVLDTGAWDFGQTWVRLALGLFAAALLVGVAHQSVAAIGAERAVRGGDHAAALRRLTRWLLGAGVILLLQLVAVWDMVFKPGM